MAWVRSEYAGEFAVISAWLSMVLPWNIVYYSGVPTEKIDSLLFAVRFSILELQFRFPGEINVNGEVVYTATDSFDGLLSGIHVFSSLFVTTPPMAATHHDGYFQLGSLAWTIGAFALLVSFAVSIAFYLREAAVESRLPADPVRLIGGLLGTATVALSAASVLYFLDRDLAGIPIPVGVLVMGALSVALLRVERT